MSNMKLTLWYIAAIALFTSCSQDEPAGDSLPGGARPLVINASGLQAIATPQTRGTLEGNWDEVKTVGVQVKVTGYSPSKEYKVEAEAGSGNAHLSPAEPLGAGDVAFWWTSTTETKTVTAWCPYGEGYIPSVWTIPEKQTAENMQAADLLFARKEGMNDVAGLRNGDIRVPAHAVQGADKPQSVGISAKCHESGCAAA